MAIYFTYELPTWVIGVIIKTRYCSHKSDFYRSDLSAKQFTLFMNYTFGSTFYLRLDAVMTARPYSHKSKFFYHFIIMQYEKELSSNKGLIEKL